MTNTKIPWATLAILLAIFATAWLVSDLLTAMTTLALALGVVTTWHAFAFAWHYRKVNWQATRWGVHVMRFSIVVGLLFGGTVLLTILALAGMHNRYVALGLTIVLYGFAAWEMRSRRYLERQAQELLRQVRHEG